MLDRYLGWLAIICIIGYPLIFSRTYLTPYFFAWRVWRYLWLASLLVWAIIWIGSGSLEQDGPLSVVAMKKEEQASLVHDHRLGKRQCHAVLAT